MLSLQQHSVYRLNLISTISVDSVMCVLFNAIQITYISSLNVFLGHFKRYDLCLSSLTLQLQSVRLMQTVWGQSGQQEGLGSCPTLVAHRATLVTIGFWRYISISVRLLSVLRGHSVFSSPPQQSMTSDFEGFLSQMVSIPCFVLSLFF